METEPQPRILTFSIFELDPLTGELRKSGMRQKLAGQPLQVLQLLLERPNEIVTRDELRHRIWPKNTFVDHDLALKKAINRLREVLGDSADSPRFIETIHRRGYRFIAPVREELVRRGTTLEPSSSSASRQGSKSRLRSALVRAIGVIFSVTVIFIFTRSAHRASSPPVTASSRKIMLAVLPLDNLSGDSNQDYFSDGMTEELITQLGRLSPQRLGIIARASAMQYKHTNKGITQIGRELGVDYILEGSARREGGRLRITAQLIQVSDQTHLWAEEYDREMGDILALQAEVARGVTQAIRVNLPRESGLAVSRPLDPEAHEAFLKGRYYWAQLSCEGFLKARDYYQQAIDKDTEYAMAYAGLADAYFKIADFHCQPDWQDAVADAKAAAVKALHLDSNLGEAHASLGVLLMLYDWDWPSAEKQYERAIELNPNYETAHSWYGMGLLAMGRKQEALAELQIAHQLDPVALLTSYIQGMGLYAMRQYDAAAGEAHQIMEMYPHFTEIHGLLASIYEVQGRENEAVSEWLETEAGWGTPATDLAEYRAAFDHGGMKNFWREHVQLARKRMKNRAQEICEIGISTLALAREMETALQCTEQRNRQQIGNEMGEVLLLDPRLDQLRSQPRFQTVLRRVGLAQQF
jgi:TolB-like protein/DNA-binding winged helix-turn-helix (wHTH) protein